MDEDQLRQQVCNASHQLWMRGLIAGADGLVALELHRRRYIVTPPGRRRINLQPDDLLCVDMAGEDLQADAADAAEELAALAETLADAERSLETLNTDRAAATQRSAEARRSLADARSTLEKLERDRARVEAEAEARRQIEAQLDRMDRMHAIKTSSTNAYLKILPAVKLIELEKAKKWLAPNLVDA